MGLFNLFSRAEPAPQKHAKNKSAVRRFMQGQVRALYDGAKTDRLTADVPSTPLPADEVIRRHQRILVARSRHVCANNDYAKAFLRMVKQNIVGPNGIVLQAQARDTDGTLDELANQALQAAWMDFCKPQNCDITGQQSMRSLENSAAISAAKDGEFFFKIVTGGKAGKWRVALQILDPQRCDPSFDNVKMANGNWVRAGIEFNEYGKPVGYWFSSTDAKDSDYYYSGRWFKRVDASEIIHGFMPEMVGQKRGLPWTATSLWRMNMLGGFDQAALVNARASAAKNGFFEWEDGFGPDPDDESEELYMDAEPGTYQELPPGLRFKPNDPTYPVGEYLGFSKTQLRAIASGFGVSYNNLANDLENVNFSSIRQGTLDEREHWKELQQWLVETLLQRVFDEWLPRALLVGIRLPNGGTLRADQLDKYREIKWQPRRWQWVDPRADVDAAIKSKNSFLASPGSLIREQGKDPNEVWREIGRDIDQMRANGIPDEFIWQSLGAKITGASENEDEQSRTAGSD